MDNSDQGREELLRLKEQADIYLAAGYITKIDLHKIVERYRILCNFIMDIDRLQEDNKLDLKPLFRKLDKLVRKC